MNRRRVIYSSFTAWVPIAAGAATLAFATTSHQVVNKTVLFEESTSYVQAPVAAAETVTVDKWYRELSQPVRRKQITGEEGSIFAAPPKPEARDAIGWHRPLDEPARLRRLPPPARLGYTFVAAAPGSGVAYNWFGPLDEPLRIKRTPKTDLGYGNFTPAPTEVVTIDKWWRELDRPTRIRPQPTQLGLTFLAAAPGRGVAYNWFSALDTPVRARTSPKTELGYGNFTPTGAGGDATLAFATTSFQIVGKTVIYDDVAYSPFTPTAETITIDKWWRELDRPVRRIPVTSYQPEARDPFPRAPWGWYVKLDDPTRRKIFNYHQPESHDVFPQVPRGWYVKLDEPQKLKRLSTGQIGYTFVAAAPGSAVVQNWFHQLDTPTRARTLRELPYSAIPVYFVPPTPGSGLEYNWWSQLDEPIRPRLSIRTAQQWPVTVPPRLLTTTLEFAWHQRLSEPVRLKQTFGQYPGTAQGNVDPVVPYGWQQLQTPYRLRGRVNYDVAQAPYLQIELITADKWWRQLERPIYTKRIDRPALAQGNVNPIVPYAHLQLHAPLRLKGRIDYPALIRPSFPFSFPGTGLGTAQPWPALSEPVRFSPRLRPSQQQFLSHPSLLISSDLDPACRVIDVFDGRVISSSSADDVVVAAGQSDLTPSGPGDDLTPVPGNIVKVKC